MAVMEQLNNLKGANITLIKSEELSGVRVEVTKLKLWQENLRQLIPLFGKVIFEEYEKLPFNLNDPTVKAKTLSQLKISFNDISYMYILEKNGQFLGLLAMKIYKENPRIEVVVELIIDPLFRGQGYAPKFYDLVFKDRNIYAITSYSRYPAAVKSRYQVGNKYGYKTYFGNMSDGVKEAIDLQNEAKDYFTKEGIVASVPAPQGYIWLKGEENVNAPLKEGDAKFKPDDPLYKPFQKILELQKLNAKDTCVGLLVSIRK